MPDASGPHDYAVELVDDPNLDPSLDALVVWAAPLHSCTLRVPVALLLYSSRANPVVDPVGPMTVELLAQILEAVQRYRAVEGVTDPSAN